MLSRTGNDGFIPSAVVYPPRGISDLRQSFQMSDGPHIPRYLKISALYSNKIKMHDLLTGAFSTLPLEPSSRGLLCVFWDVVKSGFVCQCETDSRFEIPTRIVSPADLLYDRLKKSNGPLELKMSSLDLTVGVNFFSVTFCIHVSREILTISSRYEMNYRVEVLSILRNRTTMMEETC